MISRQCPICGKPVRGESVKQLPDFPFCSGRCRLIDLGRWLDGRYGIPRAPRDADDDPDGDSSPASPAVPAADDID